MQYLRRAWGCQACRPVAPNTIKPDQTRQGPQVTALARESLYGFNLSNRPRRCRRHRNHGPAHGGLEGRLMGCGGRHLARFGRVYRPRRCGAQHGAAPGRDPFTLLADTLLAALRRTGGGRAQRVGDVAALVVGHVAGAGDPPAAGHHDGVRHPTGVAVYRLPLRRRQRLHHRPAVYGAAASGRRLGAGRPWWCGQCGQCG